ncbi:hypothetical protein F5Y16DRAFT_397939 [Xylariaceae sp. FL0255]|nr:hypothetical protein F5Y16DRAFT_397939 [Xylariaceae sp. FL0255]
MAQMIMNDCDANLDDVEATEVSLGLINRIFELRSHNADIYHLHEEVMQWAWSSNHLSLFVRLVAYAMKDGNQDIVKEASKLISDYLSQAEDTFAVDWDKYLGEGTSDVRNLSKLGQGLDTIQNTIDDILKPGFEIWREVAEQNALQSKTSLDDEDFYFIISRLDKINWAFKCLIPALDTRGTRSLIRNLGREILVELLEDMESDPRKDIAVQLLQNNVSRIALDLQELYRRDISKPKSFFEVLEGCLLTTGLEHIAVRLLEASWTNIDTQHKNTTAESLKGYRESLQRSLRELEIRLCNHEITVLDSTRNLFELLIRRYIYPTAPKYPVKLPGWSQRPRGCYANQWGACDFCGKVNKFLQDQDASEHTFKVNEFEGQHMRREFSRFRTECHHDKEEGTFKISKVLGQEFSEDLEKYDKNLASFEESLAKLRTSYMKQLLGDATYRKLIMLENIPRSQGAAELARVDKAANEIEMQKISADEELENLSAGKIL